jgi:hypothetical protein
VVGVSQPPTPSTRQPPTFGLRLLIDHGARGRRDRVEDTGDSRATHGSPSKHFWKIRSAVRSSAGDVGACPVWAAVRVFRA